jgi:hypothetical protein
LVRNQLIYLSFLKRSWKVAGETSVFDKAGDLSQRFRKGPHDSKAVFIPFHPVLLEINRTIRREA